MRRAAETIKATAQGAYAVDHMWPQEKWVDKSTAASRFGRDEPTGRPWEQGECEKVLTCWRVLCRMSDVRAPALIILHALYGPLPPGLPEPHIWHASVDLEYRRVCRYVPSALGGGVSLDAALRVERKKLEEETDASYKARVASASVARAALRAQIAAECEHAIVDATHAYRAAKASVPT